MSEFLIIDQVTRRFGVVTAVENVSFRMLRHETLGLMGANGAGKTTLFSMIAGNLPPSQGQIRFEGGVVPASPQKANHLGIARTFQIVRPFPNMTVLENCLV